MREIISWFQRVSRNLPERAVSPSPTSRYCRNSSSVLIVFTDTPGSRSRVTTLASLGGGTCQPATRNIRTRHSLLDIE